MGSIRRGRSQREDIPTISKEWVDEHTHILTPRDKEMLKLLHLFPVMTTEHLVTLTPETKLSNGLVIAPFYKNKKAHQLCRDRVRKLYDFHFINKVSPRLPYGEGTAPQYIWLDRAGYKFLNVGGRPNKALTTEYKHHAKILDVVCLLTEMKRDGLISIDYLKVCYTYKPKTANIEPDIIVSFKKGRYGYKYFIEVDTGEKKESEETKKLTRYRDWELSSQWIKEEWATLYKQKFPVVLYICTGEKARAKRRINVLNKHAKEEDLRISCIEFSDFASKIDALPT